MTELKCVVPREFKKTVDGKEVTVYRCPHCGRTLAITETNCQGCGSFIDWGDDEWSDRN